MYITKSTGGWASDLTLPALVKNTFMHAILDESLVCVNGMRCISVRQGEGENPEFYCETTGEAIIEGIAIMNGWMGLAGVKDEDLTIVAHGPRLLVYFGQDLWWFSSNVRLERKTAQDLVNKYEAKTLNREAIISFMVQAYNHANRIR